MHQAIDKQYKSGCLSQLGTLCHISQTDDSHDAHYNLCEQKDIWGRKGNADNTYRDDVQEDSRT